MDKNPHFTISYTRNNGTANSEHKIEITLHKYVVWAIGAIVAFGVLAIIL